MTAPTPSLSLPGNARDALTFYQDVFGGEVQLYTLAEFGRSDGEPDAIAHGMLSGPVMLFASDAGPSDAPLHIEGVLMALLGAADEETSRTWFASLAASGQIIDDLQLRPWGDWDGQVKDQFGIPWLIGFQVQS